MVMQSRVLPLAWRVMPQQEKWDQGQWELLGELFALIAHYLTSEQCTLLADRGLSCLALIITSCGSKTRSGVEEKFGTPIGTGNKARHL